MSNQPISEKEIQNQILLACGRERTRLFRNNVGGAKLADGRWLNFGLHKGSSDLIGWRTVQIKPEMVGKTIAQFVSIEVKNETGRISNDQKLWIEAVNKSGGLAFVARSGEEALDGLQ